MKRIIVIAALATVAACSEPAPAPEPATEVAAEDATAAAAETLAADGKPSHGTFKVTRKAGIITSEVKPDGTYSVASADGKVLETGKWEQKSPALYCETADTAGAKQKCFAEKVDDKGIYTSKDPDTGEVATVVRVEG